MTPPCAVRSPMRAAGKPPMRTVVDACTITSGGPTHIATSVTRAAGSILIRTVGQPGAVIGPPTCGTTPVTIGQVCISVSLAAGCPIEPLPAQRHYSLTTAFTQGCSPAGPRSDAILSIGGSAVSNPTDHNSG